MAQIQSRLRALSSWCRSSPAIWAQHDRVEAARQASRIEAHNFARSVSLFNYDGNWKLQVENGADGYHVSSVRWNYAALLNRYLWFAKIADGIQIKELADPPDFVCARMILTSCCAC